MDEAKKVSIQNIVDREIKNLRIVMKLDLLMK